MNGQGDRRARRLVESAKAALIAPYTALIVALCLASVLGCGRSGRGRGPTGHAAAGGMSGSGASGGLGGSAAQQASGGRSTGGDSGGGESDAGEGGLNQAEGGTAGAGATGGSGTAAAGAGGGQSGAGGSSPLSNLPLPAGCEALRGAATELLCNIDVSCGAEARTTRCYHTSSGAFQCGCEPPESNRWFLIEGAAGLDVCAVGAGLCAGLTPDPGFVLGGCVTTREEVGIDHEPGLPELPSCTVEVQCQRPVAVDFAQGVRATMPGGAVTHCVETLSSGTTTGQRRIDCDTTGTLGDESHAVVAESVAAACRPILELYLSSQDPVFDGSTSCVTEDSDNGARSCMRTETCFDSAPVSSEVSVVRTPSERSVFCGLDDLDHLACGCRFESTMGAVSDFGYDLGVGTEPVSCDVSGCTLDMRAEPTGPGSCQVQQNTGEHDDDTCTDDFSCAQPATLDGRQVTIGSWLNVRCARANDDAFYCGCASGDETATFRADNAATSVDACALARTECLAHLTLPLGPASQGARAPDPLLGL